MTTPPTPPTDNLAAEGGPRSEMSEECCSRTERHCGIGRGITGSPCCPQCEHGPMTAEREGLVEELHEALYAHRTLANSPGDAVCACDRTWRPTADYRAHLADALADLLAARDRRVRGEAWEAGHDTCCGVYLRHCAHAVNPYAEADA